MSDVDFGKQLSALQPVLRSLSRHFTHDSDASRDLVQDTLVKAWAYRKSFQPNTNLKGWLFTIMRNTFINQYRREKLRLQASQAISVAEELDTYRRPEGVLEFKEVWLNIHQIPDALLTPFKMLISGYKYHEIAGHLRLPIGTVKNRIFHARREIQKRLAGYS